VRFSRLSGVMVTFKFVSVECDLAHGASVTGSGGQIKTDKFLSRAFGVVVRYGRHCFYYPISSCAGLNV
jgi:hypothetical protein